MKTYLITGAGSGIGQAIALQLSRASAQNRLVLAGRDAQKLQRTLELLEQPGRHLTLPLDLAKPASIQKAVRKLREEIPAWEGVIANAGVGGENHYGAHDRWDEIIATNLTGTYTLIQECLPALRASSEKYRHIVMVSSILARLGVPGYTAYCASKAGLLGLTRSLAAELASERILVNAICPGWVDTQMSTEGLTAMAAATGQTLEAVRRVEMSRVPLGKMSQPQEIAALIQFLMSDQQISITGQALDINGGAFMP